MVTRRDKVETALLEMFPEIRPFTPEDSTVLGSYQDGKSFGLSALAFALYSNGHNLRGKSTNYPYGLFCEDEKAIFSLGYYRKEHDAENADGYLMIVSPRGEECLTKVQKVIRGVREAHLPCRGVYLRFLPLDLYLKSLQAGFLPISEFPWHPEAPKEDETYNYSLVNLEELMEVDNRGETKIKLVPYSSKNSRSKARDAYSRFNNFLHRNNLTYSLIPYTPKHMEEARQILFKHFSMLKEKGKAIGSTLEDHLNSLDSRILQLGAVKSYVGYLGDHPVSLFVGERLTKDTFALYTSFTLRNPEKTLPLYGIAPETDSSTGFTAASTYACIHLFSELFKEGIQKVHLGGSETADLNRFKRQIGAANVPSYWAVKQFKPSPSKSHAQ